MTAVMYCEYVNGHAVASDDIAEVKWFDANCVYAIAGNNTRRMLEIVANSVANHGLVIDYSINQQEPKKDEI